MRSLRPKIVLSCVIALVIAGGTYCYLQHTGNYVIVWDEKIECADVMPVINSDVIQRLKYIDQSGGARYFSPKLPPFSRYEHSIGVYAILKKAGASKKELVAGLLHDASHTVFSHVGDYIWTDDVNEYTKESYQDKIHREYLRKNKMEKTLNLIDITLDDVDINKNDYKALEQHLPDMCADRIQYNIHTGVIMKMISHKEIKEIMENLKFKDNKWFFTNLDIARKFANLSIYFTQNFWGAKWNTTMNIHFANALKRALKLKIIMKDDLFSTDEIVLKKLTKSNDRIIQLNLQQCQSPLKRLPEQKYRTEKFFPKFRGIDPLIRKKDGTFSRLSEMDIMFKNNYDTVKQWCKDGYAIDVLAPLEEERQ